MPVRTLFMTYYNFSNTVSSNPLIQTYSDTIKTNYTPAKKNHTITKYLYGKLQLKIIQIKRSGSLCLKNIKIFPVLKIVASIISGTFIGFLPWKIPHSFTCFVFSSIIFLFWWRISIRLIRSWFFFIYIIGAFDLLYFST